MTHEPQVLPVLTVNPTGIFGNRARETSSLSSRTETGSVGGLQARRAVNPFEETISSSKSPGNGDVDEDDFVDEDDDADEADSVTDDLSSPDPIGD